MDHVGPSAERLADWALSRGVSAMTTVEVARTLGVSTSQVPERLARPQDRVEWVTPARGLWVPVSPEYRGWGGPPASELVGLLMDYLKAPYYVGWLAAAATYGATHHAPQVTDVATTKQVRNRTIGRVRLEFHCRSQADRLPVVERMAAPGPYRVSTPEVTALDLVSGLNIGGRLGNVATVVADLATETGLDDDELVAVAPSFGHAAVRRVGWLVERLTEHRLDGLHAYATTLPPQPSFLKPTAERVGSIDTRWNLCLNSPVEVE